MGEFYQPKQDDRLWLYSERGLMSYLFLECLKNDLSPILDHAVAINGTRLRDAVGPEAGRRRHRVFSEFDLGKRYGFGCPDGGILIGVAENNPCFVFVEGKAVPFDTEYRAPQTWAYIQTRLQEHDARKVIRPIINGFNSSVNGQLELRWRFVNAFRACGGNGVISEKRVVRVSEEHLANDVFYLKAGFAPMNTLDSNWRSVDLRGSLVHLAEALRPVKEFLLLSITADRHVPPRLSQIRLTDEAGELLSAEEAAKRIYWMPLSVVVDLVEGV